jgi:hypothetical protein
MNFFYLLLSGLLYSFSAFATFGELYFVINPGGFHRGGSATAKISSVDEVNGVMNAQIDYVISPRSGIPFPEKYEKGSRTEVLPLDFRYEYGFRDLEAKGEIELPKAWIKHLGRVDWGKFKGAHKIEMRAKNNLSIIEIIYHPDISYLGWAQVTIKLLNTIPTRKVYLVEAVVLNP